MDDLTNYNDHCRVCLDQTSSIFNLCDLETKQRFEDCTSVRVIPDQDFPTKLCTKCHNQLMDWNAFRTQAMDTDRRLQRMLIANCSIKTEIVCPTKAVKIWENHLAHILDEQSVPDENRARKLDTIKCVDVGGGSKPSEGDNQTVDEGECVGFEKSLPPLKVTLSGTAHQKKKSLPRSPYNIKEERPFKCESCPAEYKYKSALLTHQRQGHAKQTSSKLKSSGREEGYSTADKALQQNRLQPFVNLERIIHLKSEEQQRQCSEEDNSERHLNVLLSEESTSQTPQGENSLPKTILGMSQARPFKCQFCDTSFKYRSVVAMHVRKVHAKKQQSQSYEGDNNENRPFECMICHKHFRFQSNLEEHERTHKPSTTGKVRQCLYCARKFQNIKKLAVHERTHVQAIERHITRTRGPRNVCSVCNKRFTRTHCLKDHWKAIHPADFENLKEQYLQLRKEEELAKLKVKKRFGCEICFKEFIRRPDLKQHIVIHSDERPFKCSFCDATSKYKRNISYHERNVHLNK